MSRDYNLHLWLIIKLKERAHLDASSGEGLTEEDEETVCLLIRKNRRRCFFSSSKVVFILICSGCCCGWASCRGLGITIRWDFSGSTVVHETMMSSCSMAVEVAGEVGDARGETWVRLLDSGETFFFSVTVFDLTTCSPSKGNFRIDSLLFRFSWLSFPGETSPVPIFEDGVDEDETEGSSCDWNASTETCWREVGCDSEVGGWSSIRMNEDDSRSWVSETGERTVEVLQQQQDLMKETIKVIREGLAGEDLLLEVKTMCDDDVWPRPLPCCPDVRVASCVSLILPPSADTFGGGIEEELGWELKQRQHPAVLEGKSREESQEEWAL